MFPYNTARQKAFNRNFIIEKALNSRKGKIMWKHKVKKESTHGSHVILLTCY